MGINMETIKTGEVGQILKANEELGIYEHVDANSYQDEDDTDFYQDCSCRSALGCKECLMTEW